DVPPPELYTLSLHDALPISAPRMREMIMAIKAIWESWNDGSKLEFRGDFYQHTLMTPFFNPGPNPYGNAKIFLAGVGELMTEVRSEEHTSELQSRSDLVCRL